jgi:hypothetical protein
VANRCSIWPAIAVRSALIAAGSVIGTGTGGVGAGAGLAGLGFFFGHFTRTRLAAFFLKHFLASMACVSAVAVGLREAATSATSRTVTSRTARTVKELQAA